MIYVSGDDKYSFIDTKIAKRYQDTYRALTSAGKNATS